MKIKLPDGTVKELSSTTAAKEGSSQPVGGGNGYEKRFAEAKERIKSRGTIQGSVKERLASPSYINKAMGVAEILSAPASALESGIANVGLEAQQGNLNPMDLLKQAGKGALLQERGQYSDIYKNAGVPPLIADAAGLFLNVAAPLKALQTIKRIFGSISMMSDKGIMSAGKKLVYSSNQAKQYVGQKVGEAFASVVDDTADGVKFLDNVVDLPKSVMRKAEETFGNLDDFANDLTVGKLREFKQFLGKLRPSDWGKSERGIAENIDVEDLNKVYSGLKDLMTESVTLSRGKDMADRLMALESNYSDVMKASQLIRKTVVNNTLNMPTEGGKAADKLIKGGDVSLRTAMNIIKKSGSEANRAINSSMRLLEKYNRNRFMVSMAEKAAKAAVFGGAAGAAGGKALSKATDKN